MSKRKYLIPLATAVILAVLALAAAACGGGDGETASAREIWVAVTDTLRFEPAEIRLSRNQPVRLALENSGSAVHDLTVDNMAMKGGGDRGASHDMGGMNVGEKMQNAMHLAVDARGKETADFTPMEAGAYTFYCTVSGHKEAGMVGTMIVE